MRIKNIFYCVLTVVLLFYPFPMYGADVLIETPSGKVLGISKDGINIYKGIPYAKPPIGNLRFAPPQDIKPWVGVLKAKEFGDTAIQVSKINNIPMSENCLTLNIWTPAQPNSKEKYPVYVFIHGGAWTTGSGADDLYNCTNFAKDGIVAITINYRLGALGFFASYETFQEYSTTGNWGILDQIKALEWINKNISAFGGDSENITIGGESAGSYSVSALMISPLAQGLFQKVIMESGDVTSTAFGSPYSKADLQRSIQANSELATIFGASDDKNGLKKLREADPYVLTHFTDYIWNFMNSSAFFVCPVFDGCTIPTNPYKNFKNKKFTKVKLLCGYNSDEGSLFIPPPVDESKYKTLVYKMFGVENAKDIIKHFPIDKKHTALDRARQIVKLGMFSTGTKIIADILSQDNLDVWMYYFNYKTEENIKSGIGAHHAMELAYVFGNFDKKPISQNDKNLSREMHTRFANFIKTGDPNKGDPLPSQTIWPKYNTKNASALEFNEKVKPISLPEKRDLDFMAELMFRN
jgi:para-nitrobenzyl esterase